LVPGEFYKLQIYYVFDDKKTILGPDLNSEVYPQLFTVLATKQQTQKLPTGMTATSLICS
jgi:hypothetical protein